MTKDNSLSPVLCFCGLRADCLKSKVTSGKELSIYFFGYPRASRHRLKFARLQQFVVATVAVATTGPPVSTLYASLFSCCLKTDCVASCLRKR